MTADRNQSVGVRRVRAGAGSEGQRLDNFLLRELAGVPRSRVYRLLRRGEVRVNGKRKQADYRLAADDEVRLPPLREAPAPDSSPRRLPDGLLATVRSAIVHEDERLLVLDKPAGLAVHGGSGLSFGAIEALRALRPDETLELVHRLDRDTSGCLLVARTRPALRLAACAAARGHGREALRGAVAGRWRLGRKTIDAPVLTNAREGGERVVRVHRAGKIALTDFNVDRRTIAVSRRSWTSRSAPAALTRSVSIRLSRATRSRETRNTATRNAMPACARSDCAACSCTRRRSHSAGRIPARLSAPKPHCRPNCRRVLERLREAAGQG